MSKSKIKVKTDLDQRTIGVNIKGCARCGEDHKNIKAHEFYKSPVGDYTHFAMCPVYEEPILIKIKKDGEGVGK